MVETHRIAVKTSGDQDEPMEDLAQIQQQDFDKDGKLTILGKDEQREALARCPDGGTTFVMGMLFELLKDLTNGTHEQAPLCSIEQILRSGISNRAQSREVLGHRSNRESLYMIPFSFEFP